MKTKKQKEQSANISRGARNQPTQLETRVFDDRILVALNILVTIALTTATLFIYFDTGTFNVPPFEVRAMQGNFEPPENSAYGEIATENFLVGFAGLLQRNTDDSLQVYFVNPEGNDVYLMCTIADSKGNVLYKSGLLRPGEHITYLEALAEISGEFDNATVELLAFEPETYYSKGTIVLRSTVVDMG